MKRLGKVKVILAIASLSAVALAASLALAQSVKTDQANKQGPRHEWRGEGMKRGFHGGRGAFLERLNLTDDQKAKMKQSRASFAERNKTLLADIRTKRQELRQASQGGTFNEALATQKLTEMAGLQAKLMGERFKLRQEIEGLLTAEQKAQLEQMKTQFKTHRGGRHGMGGTRTDE
jgi:Spy/CpxP family protein refolding chaperone